MMATMGVSAWLGRQLDNYWQLHWPVFLCVAVLGSIVSVTHLTISKLIHETQPDQHTESAEQDYGNC